MSTDGARIPTIKCLCLGNSNVGKTSILRRYVENTFTLSTIATLGIDFQTKELEVEGQRIKLQIWDTAGTETHRTIGKSYYRGARAILLVYDITDISTFRSVQSWINDIDRELGTENVCIILVGNKIDLEDRRQVTISNGASLAKSYGIPFYETSSLQDINLNEVFTCAVTAVLNSPVWSRGLSVSSESRQISNESVSRRISSPCC